MHYGMPRRSGRYPWGSGDRPYQGDGISAPKKHGLLSFRKKEKKASKQEIDLDKLSSAEYEKAKRQALKTGNATEILRFKGDLTTKEMQDAVDRIRLERNLADFSQKERDDGWNAVNNAMKKVGDVKNWTKTGIEIVNMIDDLRSKSSSKSSSKSQKGAGK